MDPLILLSFLGIFGVLAAELFWSECCMKKTVGGVPYTLVDDADTSNFNCMSNCVYERDDNPGGGRFCFKEGNFKVVCNEDSTSALTQDTTDTTDMSIVIVGGLSTSGMLSTALPSTEECLCTATECTCKICPYTLLEGRYSHTLVKFRGVPALCGGGNTDASRKSCLALSDATGVGWIHPATTVVPRIAHSSLSAAAPYRVLVLGGSYEDSRVTTELVDRNMLFSLKLDRNIDAACSIPDGSYVIITGGGDNPLTAVSKYNFQGQVTLPILLVGRMSHGCGSYINGVDTMLVVAGGLDINRKLLLSTEVHKIGSPEWTPGQALPKAMFGMASASIEQGVIILGGQIEDTTLLIKDVVRTEILAYKGDTWTPFGNLKAARTLAAATTIASTSTVCD